MSVHGHEHIEHEGHSHLGEHFHEPLACDGEGHEHHPDGSCCCHHHEVEYHGMNKVMAARLVVAAVLYLCGMLLPVNEGTEAVLMVAAAFIAGYDIVIQAVKNLFGGHFFDEYFLMTFAAIAACIIGEYEEGAAVMVLYRVGEACQDYAIRHSQKTFALLTGSVTHAESGGKAEKFITKFARVYTPIILIMALAVAVFLPVFDRGVSYSASIYRALTFLVLACPCAIVISVPLAYFAGIGAASKKGIFFHDSTALDLLAKDKAEPPEFVEADLNGTNCLIYGGAPAAPAVTIKKEGTGSARLARKIARKTRLIAFENIYFVILVKLAVLVLSVFGVSALWFAVFADSGVAVVAILNSLRAFSVKK